MFKTTVITALLLIILGLYGYGFGTPNETGHVSPTALIPAFFGLAFLLTALLGLIQGLHKHVMHLAALLSLVGIIGSGMRLSDSYLKYTEGGSGLAFLSQALMVLFCSIFLILCIRSFIIARILKDK